jgi:hypothetical protein
MNDPAAKPAENAPGHYGAAYGEQSAADTQPGAAPTPDLETPIDAPAGLEPITRSLDPDAPAASADDSAPVVFTADDVAARPPDRTPTEGAPASEKAGLIFERS